MLEILTIPRLIYSRITQVLVRAAESAGARERRS